MSGLTADPDTRRSCSFKPLHNSERARASASRRAKLRFRLRAQLEAPPTCHRLSLIGILTLYVARRHTLVIRHACRRMSAL